MQEWHPQVCVPTRWQTRSRPEPFYFLIWWKKKKNKFNSKAKNKTYWQTFVLLFPSSLGKPYSEKSSSLYYFFLFFFFPKIAFLSLSITEQKRQSKIKALLLLLGDKPMFLDCCIVTVQTVWLESKVWNCSLLQSPNWRSSVATKNTGNELLQAEATHNCSMF